MRIYLADLGHNLLTKSSDVYPLGIANIATYTRANAPGGSDFDIRLFREPQDLKVALDERAPDILGLSNYAWNEQLSLHFASYAKKRRPSTLTVFGGPNWPLVDTVQEEYLHRLRDVDVHVDGPTYEGERAFNELVTRHHACGGDAHRTLGDTIPGNTFLQPETKTFTKASPLERIQDLDLIPSPYLAGLLDPFFATGYFPLLQIARGCPFTCAFCNSGVKGNSKIYAHSIENVKADLLYVAQRTKPESTLCLADDNFGMYERDEVLADYIAELQDTYGWPKYIRTTTGKNNGERIIKVMRKVRGALPMTSAVQSMNPEVLINIKRKNIKLDTYRQLQDELHRQGMQSYGELILCLPGETKASFMDAIKTFLDGGAKRVSAHQLMLLNGAELANPDSRERFGFKTRWRVVARNIGNYTGEPVVEAEEMVVSTPTFPYSDYLDVRVFHLLLTIFFYEGNFDEAFRLAEEFGVSAYDLHLALQAGLDRAPEDFKRVITDFLRESEEELFDSREEVLVWARKNYDRLVDGTLGGNLLSKYSMLGRFFTATSAGDFLESVLERVLQERGNVDFEAPLRAVMAHLRNVMLHAPFREAMASPVDFTTWYDVEAWSQDPQKPGIEKFRLPGPVAVRAEVPAAQKALIQAKIDTFGEHPSGLGKFTRTMFARDLRRHVVRLDRARAVS